MYMRLIRLCLLASLLVSFSSPVKAQEFVIRDSHLSSQVIKTEILVALENSINFLPFSFENLEQKGWDIVERMNEEPVIIFQKKDADSMCIVTAYVKRIPEGSMRSLQDVEVADVFREGEKENMISEGVNTGLYNLEDLQLGEENVGNKRFFTMKYKNVILSEPITIGNSLFLVPQKFVAIRK